MPLPTAQATSSLNPMSFTENQHGNVVLERLRQQRESGRFCDVFLVVHDRQFSAHRNILAACSPYFDSILKMHKVVKEQVTVNCQNPEVFELLLNYMYSGSVVIDRSSVMELLKLSNNFLVTKLKNYCAEYLDRYLDAANCLTVKELASKYNMPGLLKNACEYLEANINRCLLESNDILEYSLVQVKHLLADPNYRLTIAPDVYLRFIARWVGRKVTERESLFKELLSGAPLSQVGRETFVQLLDFEPLFDNSETARFALLQSMYENSIPLSKYESQYQALLAKHSGEVNIYFNDASLSTASNGIDGSLNQRQHGAPASLNPSPMRVEPLLDNQHHHQPSFANAVPMETVVPTSPASSTFTDHSSVPKQSHRPRDPMSYIPMVMPIVKQEQTDSAASGGGGGRIESDSAPDASSSRDQPPVLGGPTTLEATILNSENVAPSNDHLDSNRPALKLTLRLPLINRKNRLLGKHKLYRKSVTTANQTLLNKRRGRPPKFRARIRAGMDSPFYPDCGINLDDAVDDFDDEEEDDGALVVDEGNGDEAGTSNVMGADGATSEIVFRCPNCIYTANTQSRITAHIARAHSRNVIFVCSVCQYECKWNREYYTHMKSHFSGPPFNCDACEYTADRIQMLLTHRMKHTDERPFKCTQCEYRCRTKTNLLAHMRSHTGEKPFSCPECGRGFAIKSTLDQHLATHSDTRPFRCDQCNFSTKYQSHLISHKRIHTGDVFHCQFHECNYSSPKKSQLAAHLRTHLAVRAHTCKICNRSFIEKSHLVRHERIHLAEKPFKCEHCDYASSRRDKLKEHIQKHHGAAATNKQHRRRYRRAKQLAQLAAQAKNQLQPGGADASMLPAADADHVFRPIAPAAVSSATSHELMIDQQQRHSQTPMQHQQQHQQQLDMSHLLGSPSPILNRPSSAFLPHASFAQGNPSPALSLNFNLGGYDTPVVPGKDVVLGGQMAPTPTIDSLVTPDPTPRSPMSTNSLHTEPFPNAHTPTGDLQRPMSLPPALGGQPGSQWPHNQDFSFTAMF